MSRQARTIEALCAKIAGDNSLNGLSVTALHGEVPRLTDFAIGVKSLAGYRRAFLCDASDERSDAAVAKVILSTVAEDHRQAFRSAA